MFRIKSKSGRYFAIAGRRADTSAVYSTQTLPEGSMAFDTFEQASQYKDDILPYSIGRQFSAVEIEGSKVVRDE